MKKGALGSIDVAFSSGEEKAYSTAKFVADATEKTVLKLVNFNELDRDKSGFPENYECAVQEAFSNVDKLKNDWETYANALKRFEESIKLLEQRHRNKKILIVSAGVVLT